MASAARTLYIALDACDLHVAQQFAADGEMPTFARLLDEAAVVATQGPVGYFVAGNWPTIYTGVTPSRHQFLCSGQIVGGTYDWRWVGPIADFMDWDHLLELTDDVDPLTLPVLAACYYTDAPTA